LSSSLIGSLHPAVNLIDVPFSGTLRYKGEHLYIDLGSNGVRYFGQPSPAIDQAWAELIGGDADRSADFPGDIIGYGPRCCYPSPNLVPSLSNL
jgi:hypothetical protein